MLRIDKVKKWLCLPLCLLIVLGCSYASASDFRPDNEELYFGALNEEIVEHVSYEEVRKGDFTINMSCKGGLEYDNVYYIMNTVPMGTVTFGKYLVKSGDAVRKGDPICSIRIAADTSKMNELTEKIALAGENLEAYSEVNEELLNDYMYAAENAKSEADRRLGKLLYDRLRVNYDEELAKRLDEIEDMQAELDMLMEVSETAYIEADGDGVIASLARFSTGQTVKSYAYIAMIVDPASAKVVVNGGADCLNYNAEVSLVQSSSGTNVELKGRVVSCKSATLSPNLISRRDVIEIYGDPALFTVGKDVTVKVKSVQMEKAVIVSKNAVKHDNNGNFVYLLNGNSAIKRYVVTGGTNASDTWIVRGLSEGDRVVIK